LIPDALLLHRSQGRGWLHHVTNKELPQLNNIILLNLCLLQLRLLRQGLQVSDFESCFFQSSNFIFQVRRVLQFFFV
jgi:hypothetical protein